MWIFYLRPSSHWRAVVNSAQCLARLSETDGDRNMQFHNLALTQNHHATTEMRLSSAKKGA